jgi:H+/Cl- antiporter ClcA
MGTAVGDGVVDLLGSKKHQGWRRYIMTGGAAAGFSIATSSPLAAILFSMEELHKHVSPMLLTVASLSVISARITSHALAALGLGSVRMFHLPELGALAPQKLFAPLLIGVVCGLASILFTRLYHMIDKAMHAVLKRIPVKIAFPALFALVCAVGFLLADTLGSGHALVDTLFDTSISWYLLILIFLLRAVGMMVSNTVGATGGVFLPTLAFGAIVGSLCAQAMIAMGWMSAEHYVLMVVLGIAAFLGSTSRIPLTACVFAVEAMGGIHNILAIIVATTAALLVVEASGLEDFTDTMIGAKIRAISKGKRPTIIEAPLTVTDNAFVVGKEMRDVLWPNSCVVVAFDRATENHETVGIAVGDVITVRYTTYHPDATADELELLVGEQSEQVCRMMKACY